MKTWEDRLDDYAFESGFPASLFIAGDGRVVGTWILGNDYRVKSGFYGGYPNTYLKRVASLFRDKKRVLHLFSGKCQTGEFPLEHTVDINSDLDPTFVDDCQTLENVPLRDYDLLMCDPPYSVEDAEHYAVSMVQRNKVMRVLARVRPGTHIVVLDQVLWMWRKDTFALEAAVGIVRSTNHRFRMMTVFKRL